VERRDESSLRKFLHLPDPLRRITKGIEAMTAAQDHNHQAAIWGGFVPLILTFLAEHFGTGLAEMMIIGTWVGSLAWATAAFYGPETKGKVLVPDLVVA
jgi:MFS transporter, SHS family, lactate transporter